MTQNYIRNFAIIAHIDHGKSTLADRLLELTATVAHRDMQEQLLDSNPIERERGITIKLAPVRMVYRMPNDKCQMPNEKQKFSIGHLALDIASSKQEFVLNLIDTPGHVDFSYEVSRSLAACEGAVLVVDATQGVQAQTLAHLHQARVHNLTIIPVINKIDLPNADIAGTRKTLETLGFKNQEIIEISAKTGQNVEQVLKAIVERVPAPRGKSDEPLRALIFSSQYDSHKGVVVFVRIVDGLIKFDAALKLKFFASGAEVAPIEIGYFTPGQKSTAVLSTGEVGYIATGLKDVKLAKIGDTITTVIRDRKYVIREDNNKVSHITSHISPLLGYQEPKPMVFLSLFPVSADDYQGSREAMERLRLSDSAFTFRPISSLALGNGFHCGFLGLLHAEIVQERILREFGLTMMATAPSVEYVVRLKSEVQPRGARTILSTAPKGLPSLSREIAGHEKLNERPQRQREVSIQSASEFPDPSLISEVREPVMEVSIFSPKRYVGAIMQLAQEKRGEYLDLKYEADNAELTYLMPLSEMIIDFFDRLKSITEGYASLDYKFYDYQPVEVARVDILVNHEKVDALSFLVVKEQAQRRGREIVERLAEVIPRQQFTIPIQAAVGGEVIARADVKAFRKDVIQKLYGGDRTRKDKLLEAQKKGKARMKLIGRVEIPQTAFFEVLKRS